MAKTRHTIGKLPSPHQATFDEQLWPINVALVMLGAFLAGICIAVLPFDDPRIYRNAVTWLAALPIVIGLAIWTMRKIHSQLVRRAVLLSAVLSVIVNVALLVIMAWTKVFPLYLLRQQPTLAKAKTEVKVLEHNVLEHHVVRPVQPDDATPRDFQQPVPTGDAEATLHEMTRQDAGLDHPEPRLAASWVRGELEIDRTYPSPRRRSVDSAPRRSLENQRPARQPIQPWPQLAQGVVSPVAEPPSQAPPAAAEADRATLARRASDTTVPEITLDHEPATDQIARRTQIARRLTTRHRADQASDTARLPRRLDQPGWVPPTHAIAQDAPSASRRTDPDTLEPNRTPIEKQLTRAPQLVDRPIEVPEESQQQMAIRSVRRQERAEPAPQLAQTPQSVERRRTPIQSPPSRDRIAAPTQAIDAHVQPTPLRLAAAPVALVPREPGSDVPELPPSAISTEIAQHAVDRSDKLVASRSPGRAETIEATAGDPKPGGGTLSRPEPGRARPVVTDRRAQIATVRGAAQSSGSAVDSPIAAEGILPTRARPGIEAESDQRPRGALAAPLPFDAPDVAQMDRGVARRSTSSSLDQGPQIADSNHQGASLARSQRTDLPLAVETDAANQARPAPPASPIAQSRSSQLDGALEPGPMVRQRAATLPITTKPPLHLGAIGSDVARDVGVPSRRAQEQSEQLQPSNTRFVRRDAGGPASIETTAALPTDAFRRRSQRLGELAEGGLGQVSPKTEEAIELGLVFLTRHQASDGSWSLTEFGAGQAGYQQESASMQSDTAATALALLAYLGAGYHHKADKYQKVVSSALDYLVSNQNPEGDLHAAQDSESSRVVALYSHAIAAIALCEAYGMTQDPQLQTPAQKALDFIVATQHTDRGGWRYIPGQGADTSVTGWMIMALKSGELANLQVPDEAFRRIDRWLDLAQASRSERHLYRYNPYAPDTQEQRHGQKPSKTMTSVGLLMRLYRGWRRDDQWMIRGADYLMQNLPEMGTSRNNERDTYYWYYGTQVMFHMGGQHWETWNSRLHPLLVETQLGEGPMAGSWNPRLPVPDRWGPQAGRIYVTTMNLLSLEVYYRHLPLYEETAR